MYSVFGVRMGKIQSAETDYFLWVGTNRKIVNSCVFNFKSHFSAWRLIMIACWAENLPPLIVFRYFKSARIFRAAKSIRPTAAVAICTPTALVIVQNNVKLFRILTNHGETEPAR